MAQAYNQTVGSVEGRVLVRARRLRDLSVTTKDEIPSTETIDTVPRTLQPANFMGLPSEATATPRAAVDGA